MNLLAALLLVTTTSLGSPSMLVLKSGHAIEVRGELREEQGRVVFRGANGSLYSIPFSEVDAEATRIASATAAVVTPETQMRLRVSEEEKRRLLAELSKNRAGTPPPPEQLRLPPPPPAPSREEIAREEQREWEWRERARAYEEAVRQAREHRDLLLERIDRLQSEIATLLSLGYRPADFTYQTTMLHRTREQIPYADVDVRRAERAWEQFREDARRRGILPGWLR